MSLLGSPNFLLSVKQYQKAYDQAIQMFNIYEDASAEELLRMQEVLAEQCEELIRVSGLGWGDCGSLGRHLSFLKLFLDKNDKDSCSQDVKDILFFDLPAALKSLIEKSGDSTHIDQRLRNSVVPLINGGHYDSAIRKVFVVLTDRLRRAFGAKDQLDGDDLINLVFGKGGKIPVALDDSKKQAFRNLVSGFYGVYRNRYAHNDIEPSLADVGAIVEMANSILIEIEKISSDSAKRA